MRHHLSAHILSEKDISPSSTGSMPSFEFNFWSKVSIGDGCWMWMKGINHSGYGHIRINDRRYLSHRVSYRLIIGAIPEGLQLDHLCRVRACVNPSHLEPVTNLANSRRRFVFVKATLDERTHCWQGHLLDSRNTYTYPGHSNKCRRCHNESSARKYQRKQALKKAQRA